ncbi:MAG: PhoU domain-containing protein [Promethearchaeota archaeon]
MPVKRKKFKYQPISLKEIMREMKQNIDLMIDLAYSAIKFGSKDLAEETYKIEKRIHELTFLLNMQIIQTNAGGVKEAKKLEPIIGRHRPSCKHK